MTDLDRLLLSRTRSFLPSRCSVASLNATSSFISSAPFKAMDSRSEVTTRISLFNILCPESFVMVEIKAWYGRGKCGLWLTLDVEELKSAYSYRVPKRKSKQCCMNKGIKSREQKEGENLSGRAAFDISHYNERHLLSARFGTFAPTAKHANFQMQTLHFT
ncbi:hypothetical protein ASPBRDRAFT_35208 [Aspergillus brasiliensis CBS 101740]|uniref:Uncharacterized protein n=1 Tax=Aspergillus brasiliensis (strain CBS 101740 / IMI 381727 / IBT 21946) TaxID=767769 RepID=A0A1L9U461_ASPBC|nr:hypothetical protein ASPBRDRAFT_35208 [Aspergillus brasiliensis CBS 101740]